MSAELADSIIAGLEPGNASHALGVLLEVAALESLTLTDRRRIVAAIKAAIDG